MKGLRLYLILCGTLLVIYIVAMFNRPTPIDWTETLSTKQKIPYGAYVLYNRLHDVFPGADITPYRQPVYNVIAEDSVKKTSYVIICPAIQLTKADYNQLVKYVKDGNDVFIAAEDFGTVFEKNLSVKTEFEHQSGLNFGDGVNPVSFLSPHLDPKKQYAVDKGTGNVYFNKFDTVKAIVLGQDIKHNADFIKYTFGKGSLYLNANPKFFSNYSLLKPEGAAYAGTALSFVKNTSQIAWDQYYTQGDDESDSPMRVFLTNPTLQWAYYIAIFSLMIYVLYEIKRRQRIIPVIEPLSNSTMEFVTVIGQLYYEKRDNANIAHKKVLYLLSYLRDEYQLKTSALDKEFTEKLMSKLGLDADFADDMVAFMQYIAVQDQVNDTELIHLNKLIEKFYIQSR